TRAEKIGTIGGANITHDILAGHLTAILVAASSSDAIEVARAAFETPRFRVYGSSDLVGVELVSVFKNVAAIAVGIANGLELGINTVSFALARALREVRRLVVDFGAEPSSVLDLCGI